MEYKEKCIEGKFNEDHYSYYWECTEKEILDHIKEHVRQFGSQKEFAKRCGISQQFLSDILHGRREISDKILKFLHIERKVIYELTA